MAVVLPVKYECQCGNTYVEFVHAELDSVFKVPGEVRCAACGAAPKMTATVGTVTTVDALTLARQTVTKSVNELVNDELIGGR
jgi:hypothetical protein